MRPQAMTAPPKACTLIARKHHCRFLRLVAPEASPAARNSAFLTPAKRRLCRLALAVLFTAPDRLTSSELPCCCKGDLWFTCCPCSPSRAVRARLHTAGGSSDGRFLAHRTTRPLRHRCGVAASPASPRLRRGAGFAGMSKEVVTGLNILKQVSACGLTWA